MLLRPRWQFITDAQDFGPIIEVRQILYFEGTLKDINCMDPGPMNNYDVHNPRQTTMLPF